MTVIRERMGRYRMKNSFAGIFAGACYAGDCFVQTKVDGGEKIEN